MKDLIGLKFGNFTVIKFNKKLNKKHWWDCQCVCGTVKTLRSDNLKLIRTSTCSCIRLSHRTPNLINQKFNRLLVLEKSNLSKNRSRTWKCLCDCGKITYVITYNLKKGTVKSCGCLTKEKARIHIKTIKHLGVNAVLKPIEIGGLNKVYSSYRVGAKNRNIEFKLTKNDFFRNLLKSNCYYCETPPSNKYINQYTKTEYFYNGIDRLDNNIGYVESNVVSCCSICNKAKRDLSLIDFLNWIERLKNVKACK